MTAPDRPTEETLRKALQLIHHVAIGESTRAYMSIPADPKRDADLLLSAAIDELVELRREREHTTDWYRQRFAALRKWVNEEVRPLSAEVATRYFSICANGSPSPHDSAEWAETLHGLKIRGERAEAALEKLRLLASQGRAGLGQAIERIAEVRDWLHRAQGYSLPAGGGAGRVRKLIDRCDEAVNLIDEAMPPEGPR